MTTKWWKTGLSVLAMTAGLLICAVPVMGGAVAPRYDGVADPTDALSALDGSFLTLQGAQYVVVKFPAPVPSIRNTSNQQLFSLRIHMVGTPREVVGNTQILLSLGGTPTSFKSYSLDSTLIGSYTANADLPDDGLTADWFQFSVYAEDFGFSEPESFQYVKIIAPPYDAIWIDAVEALPFTELPEEPAVLIGNLVLKVASYNLQQGIDNSLDAKLAAASDALDDVNANNDASAINRLEAFISEVNAQRGKKITDAQANALINGVHNTPPLDPPNENFSGAQDIINLL